MLRFSAEGWSFYTFGVVDRFELGLVEVEDVLDRLVGMGLEVKDMGVLRGSGARHWHVSRAGSRGVLELSCRDGVGWFEVRGNRRGDWMGGVLGEFGV